MRSWGEPCRRHLVFASYGAAVAFLGLPLIRALLTLGREDVTASHLAFVPVVTITLLYLGRETIFSSIQYERLAGASVAVAGLGLWLFGNGGQLPRSHEGDLTVATVGIIVLWCGGFLFQYGRAAFRRAMFPVLFLGLMIPIPNVMLDAAVLLLKTGSTETVGALFTLTGTPYYREGFVFALPNVVIEVADECSGIRSSIGLLLTSLLAGHLYLRTGWKKFLFVVAVIPLAIFKNGVRIVSLSLLSLHVDPGFLTGQLHHEGGVVFFLLALGLLAPVVLLLERSETDEMPGGSRA